MTTIALNNLGTYIDSLAIKTKDRKWLADKLLEPRADHPKTARQEAMESTLLELMLRYSTIRGSFAHPGY